MRFTHGRRRTRIGDSWRRAEEPFADARRQLGEYFGGERTRFQLELAPLTTAPELTAGSGRSSSGSLRPHGLLWRDRALDRGAGRCRAVGVANGRNPFAIIVPCHRVIGADGSLTGYGGGIERKRFLLELEGAMLPV